MEWEGKRAANAARVSPRRATKPSTAPRRRYSSASARPMPLDAPVMKTLSRAGVAPLPGVSFMAALTPLHLLRADLGDEEIEDLNRARQAVGGGRTRFVLALHGERRHAVDLVVLHQLGIALQIALRREGVVRVEILLLVDTLRGEERSLRFRRQQIVLLHVDLVEHGGRQLVREAECVEGVIHLRVRDEVVAEGHRHALEDDIRTLL